MNNFKEDWLAIVVIASVALVATLIAMLVEKFA